MTGFTRVHFNVIILHMLQDIFTIFRIRLALPIFSTEIGLQKPFKLKESKNLHIANLHVLL